MNLAKTLFDEGNGILRLKPTWVPRRFCRPGKRINFAFMQQDVLIYKIKTGNLRLKQQ